MEVRVSKDEATLIYRFTSGVKTIIITNPDATNPVYYSQDENGRNILNGPSFPGAVGTKIGAAGGQVLYANASKTVWGRATGAAVSLAVDVAT